jgi:large subunit ribosomal protein L18e
MGIYLASEETSVSRSQLDFSDINNMISKTRIERKLERKTNPELVENILAAKKNNSWKEVAHLISYPRRLQISKNLDEIDRGSKEGDTIIIPGKVLGNGNVNKKIRIAALKFSKQAVEKLKSRKCEMVSIKDEIKINAKAQGIKILR